MRRAAAVLACLAALACSGSQARAKLVELAPVVCRVGLIELDASEFRLMCFEPGIPADDAGVPDGQSAECYDPRQIAEAVEELNWDVDRWLLLLPTPRVPEARALLRQVDHWVLLTTCDHDGVVAGYRTLKGLVDPGQSEAPVLHADSPPDVLEGSSLQQLACQQVSHSLRTLRQYLIRMPVADLHDGRRPANVARREPFVKQVAHGVHEDSLGARPRNRLR